MKGDVVYEVESENAPFTASVSLTPDALWASLGGGPILMWALSCLGLSSREIQGKPRGNKWRF